MKKSKQHLACLEEILKSSGYLAFKMVKTAFPGKQTAVIFRFFGAQKSLRLFWESLQNFLIKERKKKQQSPPPRTFKKDTNNIKPLLRMSCWGLFLEEMKPLEHRVPPGSAAFSECWTSVLRRKKNAGCGLTLKVHSFKEEYGLPRQKNLFPKGPSTF